MEYLLSLLVCKFCRSAGYRLQRSNTIIGYRCCAVEGDINSNMLNISTEALCIRFIPGRILDIFTNKALQEENVGVLYQQTLGDLKILSNAFDFKSVFRQSY